MSEAALLVERSKVEMQFKIFQEQMEYQRDHNSRMHENAQLSVLKQHEMVVCLQQLTAVIGAGISATRARRHGHQHSPPASQSVF